MKKVLLIAIIWLMVPTVVAAQAQEFTFTKTGPTTVTSPVITALMSNFGRTGSVGFSIADINRSGKVDIFDYSIV